MIPPHKDHHTYEAESFPKSKLNNRWTKINFISFTTSLINHFKKTNFDHFKKKTDHFKESMNQFIKITNLH